MFKDIFNPEYLKWFGAIYIATFVVIVLRNWKSGWKISKWKPQKGDEWIVITHIKRFWNNLRK